MSPLPPQTAAPLFRRTARAVALALGLTVALVAPQSSAGVPGDLDHSVADSGVVTTNLGGTYDWAYAVVAQPDGKLVVAGVSNAGTTHDFALARYNADLSLDRGFGKDGTVRTDFGDSFDWAYAVALQPDGKIVVGGVSDSSGSRDFAIARYLRDGSLDVGFGQRGLATLGPRPISAETIHGLVVEPGGSIVAGGVTFDDRFTLKPNADFMLTRLTPEGRMDPTFGVGGVTTTDFAGGSYDEPWAMARQPDGSLLLGGYTYGTGPDATGTGTEVAPYGCDDLALARYTPQGMLDDTFGRGGTVITDAGTLDEEISGLATTPDGHIVVAGHVNGEQRGDMLLGRFRPDGSLDDTFGGHGFSVLAPLGSRSERFSAVALQPDGRIVAAGQVAHGASGDFGVVRFTPEGALDPSFGTGGIKAIDFDGREDRVRAVAVQPDGKIVAVGPSETDFGLVRLHG